MSSLIKSLTKACGAHDEVSLCIQKALLQLRLSNLEAAEEHHRRLRILHKEYIEGLYAIIGDDKLQQYLRLHQRRMKAMKEARERRFLVPEGADEYEKRRRQAIDDSKKVIEKSGVDLDEVRKLTEERKKKSLDLLGETVSKGMRVSCGKTDVARDGTTFTAPYLYEWVDGCFPSRSEASIPMPTGECSADHSIGQLDAESFVNIEDADDDEEADIVCRSAMLIMYQMPSIGQLKVRAKYERVFSSCWGKITDECYVSNIEVTAKVRPYAQVVFPITSGRNYGYCPSWLCSYIDKNQNSHSYHKPITLDTTGYINIGTIPYAFDQGDWLLVAVGLETVNDVWSDDCTVDSAVSARYLLREAELSSTGGDVE